MKYLVRVTETLSQSFIVEADNRGDAADKVYEAYDNGEISLEYDDYDGHDVEVVRKADETDTKYYDELEVKE